MFNTVQINFDHVAAKFQHLFTGAEFVKMHGGNGELIRKYHYVAARGQCRITFFQMPGSWSADLEVREDYQSPCSVCNYILQAPLGSSDPFLYNGFWNKSRTIEEEEMFDILERFEQLDKK